MASWAEEQAQKIVEAKERIQKREQAQKAELEAKKKAAEPFLEQVYHHLKTLSIEFNAAHGQEFLFCEGGPFEIQLRTLAYPGGSTTLTYNQSRSSVRVTEESRQHILSHQAESFAKEWLFDVVADQILLDRKTPEEGAKTVLERLIEFRIPKI